jgi:hypothetical protein
MFANESWGAEVVQLAPRDVLVVYSDGIPEARNEHGAFFEEDRTRLNRISSAIIVNSLYRGLAPRSQKKHTGVGIWFGKSLLTLLMNSAVIKTGWRVIQGSTDFFGVTKKMHNALGGRRKPGAYSTNGDDVFSATSAAAWPPGRCPLFDVLLRGFGNHDRHSGVSKHAMAHTAQEEAG